MNSKGMIRGICILTMFLVFVSANVLAKTNESSIINPSGTGNIDEGKGVPAQVNSAVINAVRGEGGDPKVSAINHGGFGGAPYHKVDASAVNYYKAQAAWIAAGGYVTDEQYLTMEATLVSSDGGSTYLSDRGGCIYTQTVITGLQAGDIVEVKNDYFTKDVSDWYSFWNQAPYWVLISSYTHNSTQTINNWIIYFEPDGMGGYTMVIGSGEYELAYWDDDLTTIIGWQFRLTRDVKVWQGATLQNPLTSSRGYTYSNAGINGGTQIASSSLTTPDYTYIGASNVWVDAGWTANHNGDIVNSHVYGQDAFDNIPQGINGVSGSTVNVAAGTYYESQILVNKSVSVLGAGIGSSIIDGGAAAISTTGLVRITATSNVKFSGFTIQNAGGPANTGDGGDNKTNVGIYVQSSSAGATDTISNNKIIGTNNADDEEDYGFYSNSGKESLVFKGNEVTQTGTNAVLLEKHEGSVDVSDNILNAGVYGIDAIFDMTYGGLDITALHKFSHNTIDLSTGSGGGNATGVSIASSFGAASNGDGKFTDIQITENTITGLKANRRGISLWNGSVGAGVAGDIANPVITKNTIKGLGPATSNCRGIQLINLVSNAVITNNSVSSVNQCFRGFTYAPGTGIATGTQVHFNNFTNATSFDWQGTSVLDAENNYWGRWDGPSDPSGSNEATAWPTFQCYDPSTMKNTIAEKFPGDGLGCAVTNSYVDYCPWKAPSAWLEPVSQLDKCGDRDTLWLNIDALDVEAYYCSLSYNSSMITPISVINGPDLPPGHFMVYDLSTPNRITIDLGITEGNFDGPGRILGIVLIAISQTVPDSTGLLFRRSEMRDPNNQSIPHTTSDAYIRIDCTNPTVTVLSPTSGGIYNYLPTLSIKLTDNYNIDKGYYQIDGCGGPWTAFWGYNSNANDTTISWTVPTVSQTTHKIYFKVIDDATNKNGDTCTYYWQFTYDITPPPPPTNLTAQPGHNKVKLTWNNATSDFNHTVVMRTDWYSVGHGYPEYDDNNAEGPYPADTSCCDRVYAGTGTSLTDVSDLSNTTRDVYHYKAFTVDAAGNVSTPSNVARSTSYWLGDVAGGTLPTLGDYDGYVYYQDLTFLSTTFRKSFGDPTYINEFDIGPTVTGSPKGIPTTDNIVDFEDLSVFAINYDAVNPSMKIAPIFTEEAITSPLGLQLLMPGVNNLQASGEFKVKVLLRNNPNIVKGIHFVVPYDPSQLQFVRVEKSKLLQGTPCPVFFDGRDMDHQIDVSLALLGGEVTIGGSGEIAVITFRPLQAGNISLAFSLVDLRDNQNHKLLVGEDVSQLQVSPDLPPGYGLGQNYPNTFNPETQISYQLPQAGHVSLKIYNIKGELVRTLVDEYVEAGYHTVRWDSRNEQGDEVSSGVYFYRMVTNDFTSTKKMIMLK